MQEQEHTWDFFLCHAGSDKDDAKALYELLKLKSKVFLDKSGLTPGHNWEDELFLAIRGSLITVVLLSSNTAAAEYQRGEMAVAVELERKDKTRHCVVPVLLDHRPETAASISSFLGMITRHALSVADVGGFPAIAQRLMELLGTMKAGLGSGTSVADPLLQMLVIPGGSFRMGTTVEDVKHFESQSWSRDWYKKGGNKWEQPFHSIDLPAFNISKYPTTNRQYHQFVQATNHRAPAHWQDGMCPPGIEDHPVVYVSWYDANEYCSWLSAETGRKHHLPTEAEWEKAARGADGRCWPWGNEWDPRRCNSTTSGAQRTVSVTHFGIEGESVHQVADMVGNVAEWCNSKWGDLWDRPKFGYPFDIADGRESGDGKDLRVIRGGSYRGFVGDVRCAARSRYQADKCTRALGFRVVSERRR